METIVITGANRGIGLELTKQYLQAGKHVVAGCRNPDKAEALRQLGGKLDVVQLDVASAADVDALAAHLQGEAVEVLVNNAGVWGGERQGLLDMDYAEWARTLETNVMAPLRVTAALLPNLRRAKRPRVIAISSQMGAFAMKGTGMYAYRSSKAAISKVMQTLAEELAPDGIIAIPVHPGWVQTDMGGPHAQLPVHESASGLLRLIENLRPDQSGRFWRWDGTEHPW